ncbi:hypothetical protein HAZT_HAZT012198 [Hyalella azteca]|nr:NADH-cytochrome b5 reductase-like isoform X2 [Hyalella azteca]XP_018019227.1 NADH-cytochrome b5 reductase-like isoform X2 [Hyalella azteca]XP_047737447.1 NADH-cytochrome b5 reductase-like isoform X2 [Hyalella azteca]KAA0197672.1 hypothetical protein HAZT_HAZT012198 [Hyalella azteca]
MSLEGIHVDVHADAAALPPCPDAPLPSDCCGSGCSPCVHDLYQKDLEDWKQLCRNLRDGSVICDSFSNDTIGSARHIFPHKYTAFQLISIEKITTDSYLYSFKIDNNGSLNLKVGQHIISQLIRDDGKPISRQYTPVSEMDAVGRFEVIIKLYENGRMSQLIKKWKVGDMILWRGPFGTFSYSRNTCKRIILVGAGTGIAPLYQVIRFVLSDGDDETQMNLMYASRSFSEIILRNELLDLTNYWNFFMCHYLSNESNRLGKKYRENVEFRKITKDDVKNEIQKSCLVGTKLLICGTKSFNKDMINCSRDLDLLESQVFTF